MAARVAAPPPLQNADPVIEPVETYECPPERVLFLKTITQLAVQIIFPLATVMMLAAVVPIAFQAVVLSAAAIGSTFLAGFFFQPESFYCPPVQRTLAPLLDRIPDRPVLALAAPPPPPVPLPANTPKGFVNNGNNCWLNSDLQLLESDPFIREWVRNPLPAPDRPLIPMEIVDRQNFVPVHEAFRRFFQGYDQAVVQNRAVAAGSSQALRVAISRVNALIEAPRNPLMNRQEDSHEGINPFLQHLPDNQKIFFENRIHYDTDGLPAIEGHPDGIRVREERQWGIELPISDRHPRIETMLESYCNEDVVDETGVIFRGVDGVERRYQNTQFERHFVEAPPMLRLTLKRFVYQKAAESWLTKIPFLVKLFPQLQGSTVKKTTSVGIPLEMPLETLNGPAQYRLKAFNCHTGTLANNGHYIAYSRRGDQWFCEDDTFVIPVDQARVDRILASEQPYMVWYERE